jgi:hypothetical protein
MIDDVLKELLINGALEKNQDFQLLENELQSLFRLQKKEPKGYLTNYDILFRYVSIWLLQQGYVLTNTNPHVVLRELCSCFIDNCIISEIISSRHHLKHNNVIPTKEVELKLIGLIQLIKDLATRR